MDRLDRCGPRGRLASRRAGAESADAEQLDLEDQRGAGRAHAAGPLAAVTELRGDGELALASHPHAGDPFVPSLDHLAGAELEAEGAVVVAARVELGAVDQPAGVVHLHRVASLGLGTGADLEVAVLEPAGGDDLLA